MCEGGVLKNSKGLSPLYNLSLMTCQIIESVVMHTMICIIQLVCVQDGCTRKFYYIAINITMKDDNNLTDHHVREKLLDYIKNGFC